MRGLRVPCVPCGARQGSQVDANSIPITLSSKECGGITLPCISPDWFPLIENSGLLCPGRYAHLGGAEQVD